MVTSFAFPCIDGFAYGIYRFAKGKIIDGIIWILAGWALLLIIDIITIVTKNKINTFT